MLTTAPSKIGKLRELVLAHRRCSRPQTLRPDANTKMAVAVCAAAAASPTFPKFGPPECAPALTGNS